MSKSGPRDLAEYHRKIMEREHKVTTHADTWEDVNIERGKKRLAEMGIDPAKVTEATVKPVSIETNGRVAGTTPIVVEQGSNLAQTLERARRKRSDAGTTRAKPAEPAPEGKLSESQWAKIRVYFDRVEAGAIRLLKEQEAHERLLAEAHDFIDSLKAEK